jgi:hypothetical protein
MMSHVTGDRDGLTLAIPGGSLTVSPDRPRSPRVDLELLGRTMAHDVPLDQLRAQLALTLPLLGTIALGVGLDPEAGTIGVNAQVGSRRAGVALAHFDPAIGSLGGSSSLHAPHLASPTFGYSSACTPVPMRIHLDDRRRAICSVNQIVRARVFRPEQYPPFVFNVVPCVGGAQPGERSYADPGSHWFNVFFGAYQIDCPKRRWSRPFGYLDAAGPDSAVAVDDIVRIGVADWNWFSNWMYGVPASVLEGYPEPRGADVVTVAPALERIGESWWHAITVEPVTVASSYSPHGADLVENSPLAKVWQASFGTAPDAATVASFAPTVMRARLHQAYWEDARTYHTMLFGGTVAIAADAGFLDAQVTATSELIRAHHARRGFSSAGRAGFTPPRSATRRPAAVGASPQPVPPA